MATVFKILAGIAVICVAGVLGGLVVIVRTTGEATVGKEAAEYNSRALDIVLAVTGCAAEEPPHECASRLAERNRQRDLVEGTRRIIEVDCVHRRALAGLPAPDPTRFCTDQTPRDVYPG